MPACDAVIVGAGIVGAACAAELSRRGLKVLVLEAGCIGGGATAASMGHIVVMDDSEAQLALTRYSRDLWNELAPQLPADVGFDPCGTLWVAADDEEMQEVRRKKRLCDEHGIRSAVLDANALAAAEPGLRPGLAGALLVQDDALLYPPCAARFLLERARMNGSQIRMQTQVRELHRDGAVVLDDGATIQCRIAINATGCAAPALSPEAPVRKRKGHLVITDRCPGYLRHQVVELGYLRSAHSASADSVAFNVQPRTTGQVLIGSSRQFDADDAAVEFHILQRMLGRAIEYMPQIGRLSAIRTWTGHRPATPDSLPLIGRGEGRPAIWLAAGHEGLGITTSLGTAKLLADLIEGKPTSIPTEPYAPSRFAHAEAAHA